MDKVSAQRLKRLVLVCNFVKYTLGLPLLILATFSFVRNLVVVYWRLYLSVVLDPQATRDVLLRVDELQKGLHILWSPNKVELR